MNKLQMLKALFSTIGVFLWITLKELEEDLFNYNEYWMEENDN